MNEFFYSPQKQKKNNQLQQQKHVRGEATFLLEPDLSAFSAPVFVLYEYVNKDISPSSGAVTSRDTEPFNLAV